MKRLTVRDSSGIVVIDCKSCCGVLDASQDVSAICDCEDCLRESTNRLAAIEDILGDDYDLDRLKELVEADREGKCVLLPCKDWLEIVFGEQEVFYGIDMDYIEHPIREISVDSSSRCTWYDGWKTVVLKGYDENGLDWEFSPEEIGKTVFLTREEAETALEKMKEDK